MVGQCPSSVVRKDLDLGGTDPEIHGAHLSLSTRRLRESPCPWDESASTRPLYPVRVPDETRGFFFFFYTSPPFKSRST